MTGTTMSAYGNNNIPSILCINSHITGTEILKIHNNGDIFYRYNGNMVKVNCPDDITEAFLCSVINYTGSNIDEILFKKYIEKISNNEIKDEYIVQLESSFRKLKLKKIEKNR